MYEQVLLQLDSLLNKAIKKHLPQKSKAGLYYSGGIDSALIATFADFERFIYKDGNYQNEFLARFPEIIKVIGQPIKSFSPFAWWKLGERAKRAGIKVVFSGEGADELFGGYIRWLPEALNVQAQELFPSYKSMFPASRDINDIGKEAFYGDLQFLLEAERRIAHHHGLRIIFPFLDPEIVKLAWSLPPPFKIHNFNTKAILRRLLEQRNPHYTHIEKHGLYCNVNEWLGVPQEGFNKATYLQYQYDILYGQKNS